MFTPYLNFIIFKIDHLNIYIFIFILRYMKVKKIKK